MRTKSPPSSTRTVTMRPGSSPVPYRIALPRASASAVRRVKLMRRGESVPGGTCVATSSTASPTIPRSLGTSSRIALRVTWSCRVTSERRQRLLGGASDREQRVELGELEQRLEVGVEAGEAQLAVLFANLLGERHQHPESRGVDVARLAEVDDEFAGAFLERLEDFLLQLLPVADDELSFHAHDHDAALVFLQREPHPDCPFRVWRMAIAAVFTISSEVAPRDRSAMGLANPWRIGPRAVHPPSRCTSL